MKRFVFAGALAAISCAAALCGCAKKVNYIDYISEKRSGIYLYEDDEVKLRIYSVAREQPYNADGICGDMCELLEISAEYAVTPNKVEATVGGYSGEMNYEAVKALYTLSFSAPPPEGDGIEVKLVADGKEKSFTALSVMDKGVITCEEAVGYAAEYDGKLFESLTTKNGFEGEIYVRLLYDEGCYYYVGVCDRQKNITAYLLDGGVGKIIATKKIDG